MKPQDIESHSTETDRDLIQKIRSGDLFAFEAIYKRYFSTMYRQAYAILLDEDEAKDIVQELFMNFWGRIKDIQIDTDSIFAYLYTANKHIVFKKLEKKKLKQKHQDYLYHSFQELDYATLDQLNYSDLKDKLDKAIHLLPSKMKLVFQLSRDEQLSHKEIAEKLNISDKTVKKQINNALKILKKELHIESSMIIILLLLIK